MTKDRALFALTVIGIGVGLWAVGRFTRFGLLTRACSQSEKGAYVSGVAPDRVAAANWMVSAVVCGCAGILIAPIVPLVPIQYTLFIVPALAIAVLGAFDRLGPVVIGGLAVGMIQSEVAYLRVQHDWLPSTGLAELVPLLLLLLVLVARARPLPGRGEVLRQTLGRAPRPRSVVLPAVIGTLVAAAALALMGSSMRAALILSLIFGVISLSYVVVTGYSGQVSLAQLTLAGAAGFLLGPMTTTWQLPIVDTTVPFPLAPLLAAFGAAAIGVVVGLPAVRIRGLPVAVVTLALAVALEAVWFRNTDYVSSGGKDVAGPTLFGIDLTVGSGRDYPRLSFGLLVLGTLVAVACAVAWLRTSRLGSAMLAVKANERAAAAAGVNVVRTKVAAFAIAAFIAGLGGSLLAYKNGNVTVDSFSVFVGLTLFATCYLAGITSISGGIVAGLMCAGGLVFTVLDDSIDLGRWFATIGGIGLVLTVIRNPEGLVGPAHDIVDRFRRRRARPVAQPPISRHALPVAALEGHADSTDTVHALEVRDLSVRYGGVLAVDKVSLAVPRNGIVGLIGPNGAGKTSLIDAVSGFCTSSGQVLLDDQRIDGLRPFERSRAGVGRTFQSIELYEDMTTTENVLVGVVASSEPAHRTNDRITEVLELLHLTEFADRPAGELSQGTRQLVSVARALVANPTVLLLDEPAAGLDSTESAWLGDRLRDVRDQGVAILLVDHDMSLVLGLCDTIHVLDFGASIASGSADDIRRDARVTAAYLGSTHAHAGNHVEPIASAGLVAASGDEEVLLR